MKVTMLYFRIMKLIFQKLEIFCQIQNFKHLFYKIRRKIMRGPKNLGFSVNYTHFVAHVGTFTFNLLLCDGFFRL